MSSARFVRCANYVNYAKIFRDHVFIHSAYLLVFSSGFLMNQGQLYISCQRLLLAPNRFQSKVE